MRAGGLPERAMVVGGSDSTSSACPKRFWFSRVEGLRREQDDRAPFYGLAWHKVMEEVHRWWMRTGGLAWPSTGAEVCPWCSGMPGPFGPAGFRCAHCGSTGVGPVARMRDLWVGTDREDLAETLTRGFEGWLRVHGDVPPPGLRVVGVEVPMSRPIVPPGHERPYSPDVYVVVRPDGTRRLARTGEAVPGRLPAGWSVVVESRPWWLACRIDLLWMDELDLSLYLGEHKAPANVATWLSGLSVDPQLARYTSALRHTLDSGAWGTLANGPDLAPNLGPDRKIGGWWLDVASSRHQRDPHELKTKVLKDGTVTGGGLSRAANLLASVPSWRLQAAVDRLGLPPEEWADQVDEQRVRVDHRLYVREQGVEDDERVARAERELYAEARRRAAWYRAAALAANPDDLDWVFPRVPICRGGGIRCEFRGPCVSDGDQARTGLVARDDGDAAYAVAEALDEWDALGEPE